MLRGFGTRFILAAAWMVSAATASAETLKADIKLPPGTRADPAGHYVAGRGLRDSTDFIAQQLAKKGIAAQQIGPYRVRGVELTRFLSLSSSTPWLAIHVLRSAGKTLIFFVPRAKA